MQTHFSATQLAEPQIQQADDILRKCVHCGFCTATCPTFVLTGDERDSPRGRIWMIRDFLEQDSPADSRLQYHLDRCLTCLSCMTTCPSGVDYMHLVDIGRERLDSTTSRPLSDRLVRWMLSHIVPHAGRFHLALLAARLAKPVSFLLPKRLKAMVSLAPATPQPLDRIGRTDASYADKNTASIKRVMLLAGCAQRAIDPEINAATIRLLNRFGIEVVVKSQASCCGALAHHISAHDKAMQTMRQTADAWRDEIEAGRIDAIIVNTSGCGTQLKDYGHLLADDADYAEIGSQISDYAMDISELLARLDVLPLNAPNGLVVAYHAACSLQHGQKVTEAPKAILERAGFRIVSPAESHLCCGSAGVYNVLQPELSQQLQARKLSALNATGADIVAAGNLGCINQLADSTAPICHTAQLLDWAYGGDAPAAVAQAGISIEHASD